MTKAYSYIRFSTVEQAKGDSARRQGAAAVEYAVNNGLDLDEELTFKDLGVSAFHGDNAETGRLGAFLEAAKVGIVEQGSFLLVESLDRISRQTARKALRVLEDICEAGVNVVTLSDGRLYNQANLDNDPMSMLMSLLIFIRSNEESASKSKRLKSAWVNKRAGIATKPLTGRLPEWLRLVDDQIEVIPERADVVAGIFTDYLRGVGAEGIAKALGVAGVDTWGRGKRKAERWQKTYIQKILSTPAVCGEYTTHTLERIDNKKKRVPQETINNYFPAVVDQLTFARVQELRSSKVLAGRKYDNELKNIFSGVAKCPKCAANMLRAGKGNYDYLVCGAAKAGGCTYKTLRYDKIETKFINMMRQAIVDMPNKDERHKVFLREIKNLRNRQAIYTRGIKNLLGAVESTGTDETPRSIIERITALEAEKEQLDKQIKAKAAEARTLQPTSVLHQRKALVAVMERAELDKVRCNALLNELCSGIVFNGIEEAVVNFKNGQVLDLELTDGGKFKYRGQDAQDN